MISESQLLKVLMGIYESQNRALAESVALWKKINKSKINLQQEKVQCLNSECACEHPSVCAKVQYCPKAIYILKEGN